MGIARILRIYLEKAEVKRARDGKYNLMNRIKSAFEHEGFRVEFVQNTQEQRQKSATRNGYSLFFMEDPFHARALNLRLAYYFPYWRIEETAERWAFDVALKDYDPCELETDAAHDWAEKWRGFLFKGKAANPVREGIVYVPLQGRLLERRSFQEAAPIEMIRHVLEQDQSRKILLGLHPKETYSDTEMAALETILSDNPRASIVLGNMAESLRVCDYVVSENSSAALSAMFFGKPAILFGKIDFHHLMLNVADLGVDESFARVESHRPDFDTYLHWFIAKNAIKADAQDAEAQILASVRRHGWQI